MIAEDTPTRSRRYHLGQARAHVHLARALLIFGYPLDIFERQLRYAAENRRIVRALYPAPMNDDPQSTPR